MENISIVEASSTTELPRASTKLLKLNKNEEGLDSTIAGTSPNRGKEISDSECPKFEKCAYKCAAECGTCTSEKQSDSTKDESERNHEENLKEGECSNVSQMTKSLNELTLCPSSSLYNGLAHVTKTKSDDIEYVSYKSELQMPDIMRLIQKDLSEPYSIYTYRYFIHNWPKLCFLAMYKEECVGAIVCKLDIHRKAVRRGYIAMLAVDQNYRKRKIGSNLVLKAIRAMVADDADEVVLETEITNKPALRLYENLGFVRDKRLFRYYLNGVDALRLKLWLR